MRVAFRVDAGPEIGAGHLVRCLTLADLLRTRGASTSFLCRQLPAQWAEAVRARGHGLPNLESPRTDDLDAEIAWARSCLAGADWDWIAVDHYALDARWERAVVPERARVLVIDDLANRPHECHLLLDQNYLPGRASHYAPLVPADCRLLLGPMYALLRPEYASYRASRPRARRAVRNVFVFFGGADAACLTERAIHALAHPECLAYDVTVVSGAEPPRRTALDAAAARRRRMRLLGLREHLADLMADADVAIGAGGSTTWERLCLGLPSLVVTIASNQEPVSRALARDGLIELLGTADDVTADSIRAALARFADPSSWPDVERGMAICDGEGSVRVADAMMRLGATWRAP